MPSADSTGLTYDRLLQRGPVGAWRPVVGLVFLGALFFIGQQVIVTIVATLRSAQGDSSDEITRMFEGDPVTPTFLAVVNLSWAVAILAVLAVAWLVHRQAPGWVVSVVGRLRWRWLLCCLGLSAVALVLTVMVSTLLPDQGAGTVELAGAMNPWTSTLRNFVLVVVLLTPLQAAGEEFVFRGYLAQAFGGMFAGLSPAVGAAVAVVVPAVLFALAHGLGQDVPIFFDRFAFGVVAGTLVLLTGGLEAGIAMHVLNNFLAFGVALSFGDMDEALSPTDGTWWSIPVTLTQSLTYFALTLWVARRSGVASRTGGVILER